MRRMAACWKSRARPAAEMIRVARPQPSASSTRRRARDGWRSAPVSLIRSRGAGRRGGRLAQLLRRAAQAVAQAAGGLDAVGADLLAHPADEHLDGVGIPVEI